MSGVWDPQRSELDSDPPREPTVTYVVCATPRSGSGLLCRGLAATGLGGVPAEYFNPRQREPLARRWGCGSDAAAYAAALRMRRTGANGVFGSKLHWPQHEALQRETRDPEALRSLLPGARIVRITRRDLDAQAVSLWSALYTGAWSERAGAPSARTRTVPYDYAGIERGRRQIVAGEEGWREFLAARGVPALEVVYEDLCADHAGTIRRALAGILPGVPVELVPEPDSRRQRDERSLELQERFVRERRSRAGASGRRTLRTRVRSIRTVLHIR
jgi:trehalose 2-sulfotransferase